MRLAALVLVTLGAAGCEASQPAAVGTPCAFGEEHVLAEARGGLFFGVDLVLDGEHGRVFWSDRSGSWVRDVGDTGRPTGPATRLGPGCDGGLDAARSSDGWLLACLRREVPEAGKAGHVEVLHLDAAARVVSRASLGPAGRYSDGVSLDLDGGVPVVAWHDGTPGAHRVWLARVEVGERVEPQLVSRPGVAAGAPTVRVVDGRAVVVWAETRFDANGYLVGQVLLSDLHGAPREVAVIIHDDARPVLGEDEDGLLVAYRDEAPAGTLARLFVRRMADGLTPTGEPVSVGRANGIGRATLVACEGALTTVAPRSYGRHEVLVGINRLDEELRHRHPERQIYEYGTDFSLAAADCADEHTLIVVAERGHTARPIAQLRTATLDCE